jgi:hypothetical protein
VVLVYRKALSSHLSVDHMLRPDRIPLPSYLPAANPWGVAIALPVFCLS